MAEHAIPGVDPRAVRAWMSTHGLQPHGELTMHRVGLGQSNLTYKVVDGAGQTWVLRRPPLGELLASAHDVLREARIIGALAGTDVPVPRIHGTLSGPDLGDDAPAVLMSWVDGVVIDRQDAVDALAIGARRTAGLSLASTLAAVHAVDLNATSLADLASHKPYAPRQLRRWSEQWRRSTTRELPLIADLEQRLWRAAPTQSETTLVHGDLHLRNVILSPTTTQVSAVLDWELSTLGDPLADLGTLMAYWQARGEVGIDPFVPSALDGFATRAELAEHYASASGRDISALGFWHALGLWKVAVIAEGVLRRALDEPLNRAAAGTPTLERIDALAAAADQVARDAAI